MLPIWLSNLLKDLIMFMTKVRILACYCYKQKITHPILKSNYNDFNTIVAILITIAVNVAEMSPIRWILSGRQFYNFDIAQTVCISVLTCRYVMHIFLTEHLSYHYIILSYHSINPREFNCPAPIVYHPYGRWVCRSHPFTFIALRTLHNMSRRCKNYSSVDRRPSER